jgi:hypothetical protein
MDGQKAYVGERIADSDYAKFGNDEQQPGAAQTTKYGGVDTPAHAPKKAPSPNQQTLSRIPTLRPNLSDYVSFSKRGGA